MVLAHRYYNQSVSKVFDEGNFEGRVTDIKPPDSNVEEPPLFTVLYDDGDFEDLEEEDVKHAIALYTQAQKEKQKRGKSKKRKVARAKTTGLEDEGQVDEDVPPSKSRRKKKDTKGGTTHPLQVTDSSLDVSPESTPSHDHPLKSSNEDGDSDIVKDTPVSTSRYGRRRRSIRSYKEEEEDDLDSEEEIVKKSAKRSKKSAAKDDGNFESLAYESESDEELAEVYSEASVQEEEVVKATKKRSKAKKPVSDSKKDTSGKKKMSESFQPTNPPVYSKLSLAEIEQEKEFLDPCGRESTDGVIDRLVGEQVDAIGALMQRTFEENPDASGGKSNPLRLGTACSGTDAPAIALTMLKEQWEARKLPDLLSFEHAFSCEKEPFKQAYIARNFDSVLYPDICKLGVKGSTPRDVYGKEVPLPKTNLFVAGTVCKNFSMLRSKYRIDIEDKGESGETFLAATDVLQKEMPEKSIFENVSAAPWVSSLSCNDTGAVQA
jgi:hypothetical protein